MKTDVYSHEKDFENAVFIYLFIYLFSHLQDLIQHEQKVLIKL